MKYLASLLLLVIITPYLTVHAQEGSTAEKQTVINKLIIDDRYFALFDNDFEELDSDAAKSLRTHILDGIQKNKFPVYVKQINHTEGMIQVDTEKLQTQFNDNIIGKGVWVEAMAVELDPPQHDIEIDCDLIVVGKRKETEEGITVGFGDDIPCKED